MYPLLRPVLSRFACWISILLAAGLLAAGLVRIAPGFGMDERLLDARLSAESRAALAQQAGEQRSTVGYFAGYLARLSRGDFGVSLALGRPVAELLAERARVSARSIVSGLLLAWVLALAATAVLELRGRPFAEAFSASAAGALLSIPAAVLALLCVYAGAGPALAIALILVPRLFRFARNLLAQACRAPHVLSAHALGIAPSRILSFHAPAPVFPELLALAGVSVSMALGATIPVEALCDSPGVGHLVWQAALSRDVPVLVNVTLLIAAITTGVNLLCGAESPRRLKPAPPASR